MEFKELNKEGLRRTYEVVVSSSELEMVKKEKLEKLSKEIKIQGFRPGKAPMSVVELQYKSKIIPDVLDLATNKAIDELYKTHELNTISSPKVNVVDFTMEKGLKANVEVELFPEIADIKLEDIVLNKSTVEVTSKEINESLEQIATHYKTNEDITQDKLTEKGEVVVIDFLGKIDDIPFKGGEGKDFALELGSNTFIPGFEDQLIGKKAGEKVEVKVPFPESYHDKNLAGKDSVFYVTIHKIQKVIKSTIDNELAKKAGFSDLEALKEDIKSKYTQHIARIEKNNLKKELIKKLKETKDFELPQSLLEAEMASMWSEFEHFKQHMKSHEEKGDYDVHKHTEAEITLSKKSDAEVKAEHKKQVLERIKIGLLFNDIALKNKIQVKDDDINNIIAQEATMYGQDITTLVEHYKNNAQSFKSLQSRALEESIVSFMLEKVGYKEVKVNFDDYLKKAQSK